jgi:DnaJ-class molecular chaperone
MKTLNGDGRTTSMQLCTKSIHIKPGYSCKTVLEFPKEGHQTVHGTVSDLILCIEEQPHLNFKRKGDDLIYTQSVSLADAFTCPNVVVKTLDGRTISVGVD